MVIIESPAPKGRQRPRFSQRTVDMEKLRYIQIEPLTPAQVDDILARNDPDEVRYVPISVSMFSSDFAWAQTVCVRLSQHENDNVRGNAVQSLGHLARRFGRLDLAIIEPIVRAALDDSSRYVREEASDSVDEIRHCLSLDSQWPGPVKTAE